MIASFILQKIDTPKTYGHKVSWYYHEVEQFPFLIAYQMGFEPGGPSKGTSSSLGNLLEYLVDIESADS